MSKIGIIYNESKPIACRIADQLQATLTQMGHEAVIATGLGGILGCVELSETTHYTPVEDCVPPNLAHFRGQFEFGIVLGGDGTVLSAFRQVAPLEMPLLAVNTGHMGFLTETYLNQLDQAIAQVLSGEFTVEHRSMLTVQVLRGDRPLWEALCLNEMVLHREPMTSMCHFEVAIGEHAPVDVAADGIIVATPTGSTAYALSSGGPVLTPGIPVLQLTPICPHSLASRALVFSDQEPVTIFSATPKRIVMVVDGNAGCYVLPEDRVLVTKSPYPASFIRLKRPEFFRILREKLGWGLPHIAKPTSVELP